MAASLSIRHNIAAVARDLDDLRKKQLPFALATALTWTAQEVRDDAIARLDDHFTVRTNWVRKSMHVDKALKKDPDPAAHVGSIYGPMALHAEGGIKTGRSGDVAVPVGARPTPGASTGLGTFPSKLLGRPNFFVAPFSRNPFQIGSGPETGVFERTALGAGAFGPVARGSRRRRSKAMQSPRHVKLWWTLEDDVKIKAEWPFFAEGIRVVDRELFDNFEAAMEQAVRTAR